MRFHDAFLLRYMRVAPLALAFERSLECRILRDMSFARPVLDLGCGEGLFASMLFSEKIDTGIDPNPRELKRAQHVSAHSELIQCYGDSVPKPDGAFKTIFSNSVLEHIDDLQAVLREVYRLLELNGRLYITVPTNRFDQYTIVSWMLIKAGMHKLAAGYRRLYNTFWKHFHRHSPDAWEALMMDHGFRVVECRTYGSRRVCMLNVLLVPLAFPAFLVKRLTNRWIAFPRLRSLLARLLLPIARSLLREDESCDDGGLLFLALAKEPSS